MNVTYLTSLDAVREQVAARKTGSCGWPDAPHIVFTGGWLCANCGVDTRGVAGGWTDDDAAAYWSARDGRQWLPYMDSRGEPTKSPVCKCDDPSGWAEWGSGLYCMTCSGDVTDEMAEGITNDALAEDPEWLDTHTPVGG